MKMERAIELLRGYYKIIIIINFIISKFRKLFVQEVDRIFSPRYNFFIISTDTFLVEFYNIIKLVYT